MKNYDVIIVGAGPGGIFTALELVAEFRFKDTAYRQGREILSTAPALP